MRPKETAGLQRWREATQFAVAATHGAVDLFTDFLAAGGPDAIKSLQATIRKLQAQLQEQKVDGRLERYRKLQKDLEECDKVRAGLREGLISCGWSEDEVDAHLQKRVFKANTLYGASREMLLRENRLLRAQLEEHLVTSRTRRLGGTPAPGRVTPPDSKLRQARLMQGPHMEMVAQLREAAEQLDVAERAFRLPAVRHAEAQADDGSLTTIRTLEKQAATLAGQKLQLMQQVASMTEQNRVLDMKLEGALDQVAELRRQKTEMLAHSENLSKDLREHLLAEAKRADVAEVAEAEAKVALAAAKESETAALRSMERALAEAHAMQAALQEKAQEVDTLRGLYLELREALEKLAGDVTSGQQDAARRLLEATREQFLDQRALLEDVRGTAMETHRAAQQATGIATELAAEQRVLVAEVVKSGQQAVVTLGAYERQLAITQQLLQQSEADRVRVTRQAIAASVLNRVEGKRHEQAINLLLHQVPDVVARRIRPELKALADGTQQLAEEVDATNAVLAEAGVSVGGGGRAQEMLHAPMVPDVVDDATTQLLAESRQLRAQLLGMSPGSPRGPHHEAWAWTARDGVLPPGDNDLQPELTGQVAESRGGTGRGSPPVMELVAAGPLPSQMALEALGAPPSAYAAPGSWPPVVDLVMVPLSPGPPMQPGGAMPTGSAGMMPVGPDGMLLGLPPQLPPPPAIRRDTGPGPWLATGAFMVPPTHMGMQAGPGFAPPPAAASHQPMVVTQLPERLEMVLQLQRMDPAAMASLSLPPPQRPTQQQQHPLAPQQQHHTAEPSESPAPAPGMAAAPQGSVELNPGPGRASDVHGPAAAQSASTAAGTLASSPPPVTGPIDPVAQEKLGFSSQPVRPAGGGDAAAVAATAGPTAGAMAAGAAAGNAASEDRATGERPPAHVWVPSPALLEAFRNIPEDVEGEDRNMH